MVKKVMIIVGTRPNFIKITQFERVFKTYGDEFEYILLHTNQHYDDNMSTVFFEQLGLKKPKYLGVEPASSANQIGQMVIEIEKEINTHQPDAVIVVGDVDSTLAGSIAANKTKKRLYHLESGLRSGDRDMPEEINRMLTDVMADGFFVTEKSGFDNLLNEGKDSRDIHFVGNTMIDTIVAYDSIIQQNDILERLAINKGEYVVMTMHRPSNVDDKDRLNTLLNIIGNISKRDHIVFPLHHRTKKSLLAHNLLKVLDNIPGVIITKALDYFAFQKLVSDCKYVVTDSGGIQEETTFRRIPCLTLRENTERPVTITTGTNQLVEYDFDAVSKKIAEIESKNYKLGSIPEKWDGRATDRAVEILRTELFT